MCGCVRCAAENRRTAAARSGSSDGRFVTLRVSIGWPSESGRYAADSPRQSRSYAALRTACGCDGGTSTRSAFSRILCIVHLYAVKTTEKGSLGTLLYAVKNTCTQSKKHLYAVKTTRRAVVHKLSRWTFEKCRGRTVATAPFCPRTPRRRPAPRRLRSGRTPLPRP